MAKHTTNDYLGPNLEYFRKKRGYTQEELAERANLSPAFLSRVERSEKGASMETGERLRTALDVTYDQLLCERSSERDCQSICAALSEYPDGFVDVLERFVRDTRKLM